MNYKELIEKTAGQQMPYKLPNGSWAIPKGWESADADNDDTEGTFDHDYFRKEHKIPAHYKRIADDGFGNSTFIDTKSDENNPDFYDWDHETTELTKWSDNDKIKRYSLSGNDKGRDIASKLTFDEYRNADKHKLMELGYYEKPTLKEKLSPLKQVGDYMFPGAVMGGIAGMNAAAKPMNAGKFAKGLKHIAVGAGIGAGVTGALGTHYLGIDTGEKKRLEIAKTKLSDDYWDGAQDNDFIKQYKTTLEKKAGVEYGFRVYDKTNGEKYKEAIRNNAEDALNGIKRKTPHDYGYPDWSEKGVAIIPYKHKNTDDLLSVMNGGTKNFSGYTPLENPYSGEKGQGNFLAGRDSAETMVRHYSKLLESMPQDSTFDRAEYNKKKKILDDYKAVLNSKRVNAKNEVDRLNNELSNLNNKLTSTKQAKKDTFLLNVPKKIRLGKELKGLEANKGDISSKLNKAKNPITPQEYDKLREYTSDIVKATDRDVINEYKASLNNSLKDQNNQYYEWGWS